MTIAYECAGSTMDERGTGDFDADRAFSAHGGELLGFAVNALQDRSLAEDCVQETFLRAWRARERFDPTRASERTWLFAIARNVISDAARARSRMPRLTGDAELAQEPSDDPDVLERLRIVEALSHLSDAHREVIVAVHLQGRSYAEVARASGVPVATSRTRAFHALRALRAHLDGSEDADGRS